LRDVRGKPIKRLTQKKVEKIKIREKKIGKNKREMYGVP